MAASRKRTVFVVFLFIFCCVTVFAETAASGRVLVIENSRTGRHVELPIDDLNRLTIKFFHSYDRQWVWETFNIQDGRFVPTEVTYIDDSYDYRFQRYRSHLVLAPGRSRLTDIDPRPADRLRVIITRIAYTRSQQLILDSRRSRESHAFYEWGQPGQRLVFSVKK